MMVKGQAKDYGLKCPMCFGKLLVKTPTGYVCPGCGVAIEQDEQGPYTIPKVGSQPVSEYQEYVPTTFHPTKHGMAVRSQGTGRMMGSLRKAPVLGREPEWPGAEEVRRLIHEAYKALQRPPLNASRRQHSLYLIADAALATVNEAMINIDEELATATTYLDEKISKQVDELRRLKQVSRR